MTRKKRYWIMDCRTGLDYIVDGFSKADVSKKAKIPYKSVEVCRFRFLKESGRTVYDIPFQGY